MAELREIKDLACPRCEGTLFIAVVAIRHNTGGGTVYPPRGHQCLGCHEVIDVGEILRHEELQILERQVSSLRQKQTQLQAPKTSVEDAPSVGETTRQKS